MEGGPEAVAGAAEVVADGGGVEAGVDAGEEDDEVLATRSGTSLLCAARSWALVGFQGVGNVRFIS